MSLTGVEIVGYSAENELSGAIGSLILYDPCVDISAVTGAPASWGQLDPTSQTELEALIGAGAAIKMCILEGDKPEGTDDTRTVRVACLGETETATTRTNTLTADVFFSCDNVMAANKLNNCKFWMALITCGDANESFMTFYNDFKGVIRTDTAFTGILNETAPLIKLTNTFKTKNPNINGLVYCDINQAFLDYVSCENEDCSV